MTEAPPNYRDYQMGTPPKVMHSSGGVVSSGGKTKTLYVEKLQKSYGGRRVVDGVSFTVQRGEIVGLLGRNGAGKTTSFDMVLGLVKPEKGTIRLESEDLTRLPIHERSRRGIGYLPQEASIFRKLSVMDNMILILEMRGIKKAERDRRSTTLLEQFGLDHLKQTTAVQLSGGERRRLELARCLATEPEFILLDEPFTGVDPISISDIQQLIRRLRDDWNLGVLLTDHNPRATLKITDRAYLIDNGKILVAGTSREVADSPVARKQYLGEDFSL
jgi:lipopolysaccharide export system ATP-binding protein